MEREAKKNGIDTGNRGEGEEEETREGRRGRCRCHTEIILLIGSHMQCWKRGEVEGSRSWEKGGRGSKERRGGEGNRGSGEMRRSRRKGRKGKSHYQQMLLC